MVDENRCLLVTLDISSIRFLEAGEFVAYVFQQGTGLVEAVESSTIIGVDLGCVCCVIEVSWHSLTVWIYVKQL